MTTAGSPGASLVQRPDRVADPQGLDRDRSARGIDRGATRQADRAHRLARRALLAPPSRRRRDRPCPTTRRPSVAPASRLGEVFEVVARVPIRSRARWRSGSSRLDRWRAARHRRGHHRCRCRGRRRGRSRASDRRGPPASARGRLPYLVTARPGTDPGRRTTTGRTRRRAAAGRAASVSGRSGASPTGDGPAQATTSRSPIRTRPRRLRCMVRGRMGEALCSGPSDATAGANRGAGPTILADAPDPVRPVARPHRADPRRGLPRARRDGLRDPRPGDAPAAHRGRAADARPTAGCASRGRSSRPPSPPRRARSSCTTAMATRTPTWARTASTSCPARRASSGSTTGPTRCAWPTRPTSSSTCAWATGSSTSRTWPPRSRPTRTSSPRSPTRGGCTWP